MIGGDRQHHSNRAFLPGTSGVAFAVLFLCLVMVLFPACREESGSTSGAPPSTEQDDPGPSNSGESSKDDPDRPEPPASTVENENVPDVLSGHDRYYRVDYVFDGDSMRMKGDWELRLIGIDAPEEDRSFSDRARTTLEQLVPEGTVVGVDLDRQRRDKYDRWLGYVFVRRKREDRPARSLFVNGEMVRRGLARVYLHEKNVRWKDQLIQAQREAIRDARNLFQTIRDTENGYYGVRGSYRFHRPGCSYLEDLPEDVLTVFDSKRAALMKGLSPGDRCQP